MFCKIFIITLATKCCHFLALNRDSLITNNILLIGGVGTIQPAGRSDYT